jgi:transposase
MVAMPNKTNRNGTPGLAQVMRTGWCCAVHAKSPSCRSWRALLTARRTVHNRRRDIENGVRTLLCEVGLRVGTPTRKDFPARVRELTADDPVLTRLAGSLSAVVEVMTQQVEKLIKGVLDGVKVGPTCRRLMTVLGVGPLTAPAFCATIDQAGRFHKSCDVCAHRGLTSRLPVQRDRRTGWHQRVWRRTGANGTI